MCGKTYITEANDAISAAIHNSVRRGEGAPMVSTAAGVVGSRGSETACISLRSSCTCELRCMIAELAGL